MSHEEQKSYVPRTIHEQNRGRLSILPIIPERATDGRFHLLLANVPGLLLSEEELARRQPHRFQFPHLVTSNTQSYPSDLAIYYQRHYLDLMQRLQMDAAILDCNYIRLRYCLRLFADQRIRCLHVPPFDVQLPENEQPLAMEFFLQIDVDSFCMKSAGLFSQHQADHPFAMIPCRQCPWCSARESRIHFGSSQSFVFLNGYEAILNANASCDTHGIIYVLKCACQQYEYVGETNLAVIHELSRVREHSMRLMHEFLLNGKQPVSLGSEEQWHLYGHLLQCSSAIQLFLDHNPRYWPFVPPAIQRSKPTKQQRTLQPKVPLDLFHATVIVVLPSHVSKVFRRFIQALFITHGEANLNDLGHLVDRSETKRTAPAHWWQGLIRPREKKNFFSI